MDIMTDVIVQTSERGLNTDLTLRERTDGADLTPVDHGLKPTPSVWASPMRKNLDRVSRGVPLGCHAASQTGPSEDDANFTLMNRF